MLKRINYCVACILLAAAVLPACTRAQSPVINSVTPNSASVAKYDMFGLTVTLTAGFTNPYDYNDIAVRCAFISPGGRKDTVDGFYMQDYTLSTTDGSITATGAGSFRVRYTPNETGTWQYTLYCTNTSGTATQAVQTFQCTSSATPGFIRKNSTSYLNFDDATQYIPVGEDMCWQDNNVYTDYTKWVGKLSDNKGNFIRLWMPSWGLGIEWKSGNGYAGLEKYNQGNAFYLDWLLGYCKQKGVYMMLSLDHHGQVSSTTDANWSDNPYNAVNGGPCTNTWDFFTNATARALIKNRFRYIMARYGYSSNIMCWELFNEVDWTDNFTAHQQDVSGWHAEMANYLKTIDVYKHLVTTSYAHDNNDPVTWNLPNIDFTQTHYYVGSPNLESVLTAGCQSYLSAYNKPTLNGEFGIDASASALNTTDPTGVYIHNSLWATAFSGGMGPAMSWWWDSYIEPQNLYTHFKPLSQLLATLPLKDGNYKKATASTTSAVSGDLSFSPAAGFGAASAANFTIDAGGNINPGLTQLGQFLYGSSYNTQYRNPPVFSVSYPVAGQFKVITGSSTGTTPRITITLDGVVALNQAAAVSTTYSITVAAGTHTIKVDNPGTDWITISSYVFTNAGSPLAAYMLSAADSTKTAGWVLNKQYNWQYLQSDGGVAPPVVSNATLNISPVKNGTYQVQFFDCATGAATGGITAVASNNTLPVALPAIAHDLAVTATLTSITAVIDLPSARQLAIYPNPVANTDLFITYDLKARSAVSMVLYDLSGRRVTTIYNGTQNTGPQHIRFDASHTVQAAGMYLLNVRIGNDTHTEKLLFTP